ncbi:hypothetical protein CJ030_MR8G028146 [Morella rubra]|uniref:non-specific serine/threonine protein kinase n=1 Tax=Morella rubra TaxID=262757 RepID=A0A6A1UXD2_9ROSI|nr:hypothetical protein CJ030_MR8G028146 [Morella rubra]
MGQMRHVLLLLAFIQIVVIAAETDGRDTAFLMSLEKSWQNPPHNWVGSDPCGSLWVGIGCNNSRVTSIMLTGMNLTGQLSGDIGSLTELETLSLTDCGLYGPIPGTIGSLQQLIFLDLNSNKFSGKIPNSIGNLSNLYYLDFTGNQLDGSIPVSVGTLPGLDMLLQAKHLLLDNNKLAGSIPSTLGLVKSLEVVRLDRNSLSSPLPTTLRNLTNVSELYLSNNLLTGPMLNLTGMNLLSYLLAFYVRMMENTRLQGQIPVNLFSIPNLQSVVLSNNQLNGTLNIGTAYSNELQYIDLQNNSITSFQSITGGQSITLLLVGNPICENTNSVARSYCTVAPSNSSYSTPPNNCSQVSCGSNQVASPHCKCAYPYTVSIFFMTLSSLDLGNSSYYSALEELLIQKFQSSELPVDSISLSNPTMESSGYLELTLEVFPSGEDHFNQTAISMLGSVLVNMTFDPPAAFGPFYIISQPYPYAVLAGVYAFRQKKRAERATEQNNPFANWDPVLGSGGAPQLKAAKQFFFEELKKYTNSFSEANAIGSGGYGKVYKGTLSSGQMIAIKRARKDSTQGGLEFKTEIELLSRVHHRNLVTLLGFCFDQGEQMLVYEYIPNGTLMDSLSASPKPDVQHALSSFKSSHVQAQISHAGKSGIRLDWMRRLKVAIGAARGLVYLHEDANPPIIHRDIKSNNILLDERLNAKVADFGLSKLKVDSERSYVSTQVKGTLGYMDPEYYMTQQLTEKSDVYSFGVLMLELITARKPIERGKFIVREVRNVMDKTKVLYNLQEIIDPAIGLGKTLEGLEKYVDLAMRCVEESGADRPTMSEAVKEIEDIMQLAGMNPNAELVPTSASTFDEVRHRDLCGVPMGPCKTSSKRFTLIIVFLVSAVAALASIGAFLFIRGRRAQQSQYQLAHETETQKNLDACDMGRRKFQSSPRPGEGRKGEQGKLHFVRSDGESFDLPDLLRASAEVLGSGSFGSSYKATLLGGRTVAVKRFRKMNRVGKEEFHDHMRRLGRLSHPNVLSLVAFYHAKEEKLLISDFVQNGSLASHLHARRAPGEPGLDWPTRLKIIKGVARGLAYLHKEFPSLALPHGRGPNVKVLRGLNGGLRYCQHINE